MIGRGDARGDGDGWVECEQGHRHWGRYGAAGLLARREGRDGPEVLLQHRAEWSHHGGTWGLLGGARHSAEDPVGAALREAAEEGGLGRSGVRVQGLFVDDHGGWSYVTVLAAAGRELAARPTGGESIDVRWQPVDALVDLPLHPGFAQTWPLLRETRDLHVVVDAANVVGSRPDGWWRDRAGATRRLLARCAALAEAGLDASALPRELGAVALRHWWPELTVVVEGAARSAADAAPPPVRAVAAAGAGDDTIVEEVRAAVAAGSTVLGVTADRGLRDRLGAVGAAVTGPGWLLRQVDALGGP